MKIYEHDLSHLSDDELNALFDEARKRCKSDDLKIILFEISRILNEKQNNTLSK